METSIKVTKLTHEDLVNLFSTALYGCDFLYGEYDAAFYDKIEESKKEGNCYEDKIADVLLNGGKVRIIDYYAEGCLNECERVKSWLEDDDEEEGNGVYEIGLDDILTVMSREKGYALARELLIDETGDYYTANNLLQMICFDEVVYG